ncbi:hypothetical protein Dimus_013631 [Dionaea muscipula]
MSLVVMDVDTLAHVIKESILKSISANTEFLENKMDEAAENTKTHFEQIETKNKLTKLYLNNNFNRKIDKAEENLTLKINGNSQRLTNVKETLTSLLKVQQEQNIHTKKRNGLDASRWKRREMCYLLAKQHMHKGGLLRLEGGECGDEEVELDWGLTWEMVGEAMGVEEILQPRRSAQNVGIRELHEEDFASDEEEQVDEEENIEFEFDEDHVLERYDEEEDEI